MIRRMSLSESCPKLKLAVGWLSVKVRLRTCHKSPVAASWESNLVGLLYVAVIKQVAHPLVILKSRPDTESAVPGFWISTVEHRHSVGAVQPRSGPSAVGLVKLKTQSALNVSPLTLRLQAGVVTPPEFAPVAAQFKTGLVAFAKNACTCGPVMSTPVAESWTLSD